MGKTISLMEEAVRLLSELPDNHYVFVTGAHSRWIRELEREFKRAGLVGVKFMPLQKILEGGLRGYRGALLIDDVDDMTHKERVAVHSEKRLLELWRGCTDYAIKEEVNNGDRANGTSEGGSA